MKTKKNKPAFETSENLKLVKEPKNVVIGRSTHSFDKLCECGHSMIAHRNNGKGMCMQTKCCDQFVKKGQ